MKTALLALCLLLAPLPGTAQDFLRNLPDGRVFDQLTVDKFRNADAVIILKEQSISLHPADVMYRGVEFSGTGMTSTKILMTRVFNEAGVKRFGSFEFEYIERFGDDIRAGFAARARVMKPGGTIVTMPEDAVQIEVSRKNSSGDPLARKAIFKVPDLSPGDIVQIEYTLTEPFARTLSGIYFYNERVPVLYANLAVTLLASDDVRTFSFPQEQVGEPKVAQLSKALNAGPTYLWSVRNPNPIPREPYAGTLGDLSLITAFVADRRNSNGHRSITDWNGITKEYYDDFVSKGKIKGSRITELGFSPEEPSVTDALVDSLYRALRRSLRLVERNSLYPLSDDIDDIFSRKSGDASDVAYIFLHILRQWKVDARAVWIRDRREGIYEPSVPTVHWFDRMGVLVRTAGMERLMDFDRAIPAQFESPWFLKGISVPIAGKDGCDQRVIASTAQTTSYIRETHEIDFNGTASLRDRMAYAFRGAPAEKYRQAVYDLHGAELEKRLRTIASERCIESVDTLSHSAVLEEPEISVACEGASRGAVAAIDPFVTVRLANQALQGFRDEIFTPGRFNDLVWDDLFSISVRWRVHPPAGYVLHTLPRDTTVAGAVGFGGSVKFQRNNDVLEILARLDVTAPVIPSERFPHILKAVDGILAGAGQAVTFKKK